MPELDCTTLVTGTVEPSCNLSTPVGLQLKVVASWHSYLTRSVLEETSVIYINSVFHTGN